jgi:hypothetical protein
MPNHVKANSKTPVFKYNTKSNKNATNPAMRSPLNIFNLSYFFNKILKGTANKIDEIKMKRKET